MEPRSLAALLMNFCLIAPCNIRTVKACNRSLICSFPMSHDRFILSVVNIWSILKFEELV